MIGGLAGSLREIMALFNNLVLQEVPRGEAAPVRLHAFELAETAALALSINFFLRQRGNRAGRRVEAARQKLVTVTPP